MIEKSVIVNEKDKIIGYKNREEIATEDIYRVSAVFVMNPRGQVLIAQRSFNKVNGSGKWSVSAAGTVEKGENYLDNILKETAEEIGLKPEKQDFENIGKLRIRGRHNFFCQCYLVKVDKDINDFIIQTDEVEQIKWVDLTELKQDIRNHPKRYTNGMLDYVKLLANLQSGLFKS